MKKKSCRNKKDISLFEYSFFEKLKERLAIRSGCTIRTKADCGNLSEKILIAGHGYISQSTLYRIFFQQGKHMPYRHTVDLLCQYLGYANSEEFNLEMCEGEKKSININQQYLHANINGSLLFSCIETTSYRPLNSFFDRITEESVALQELVGIQIYDCLKQIKNPESFLKYYANHPFVREFFFEKGHDPKFRIKNYHLGYGFYLKNSEKFNHLQDFIFGNCVLFRFHFLAGSLKDAIRIGDKLYDTPFILEEFKKQVAIFPFCRFIAYKLWYIQLKKSDQSNQMEYAQFLLNFCDDLKEELTANEKRILFHTLAETFLHSNLPITFQHKLQWVFSNEIHKMTPSTATKNLMASLPYFEPNGLLMHRP